MKTLILLLLLSLFVLFSHAHAADAQRAFYFGNSLTGATNPDWHKDLGQSAGKEWQNAAWLGAGWQLWQHREELAAGKDIHGGGDVLRLPVQGASRKT